MSKEDGDFEKKLKDMGIHLQIEPQMYINKVTGYGYYTEYKIKRLYRFISKSGENLLQFEAENDEEARKKFKSFKSIIDDVYLQREGKIWLDIAGDEQ